jgi:uncharacterized delta-60 repeat protein
MWDFKLIKVAGILNRMMTKITIHQPLLAFILKVILLAALPASFAATGDLDTGFNPNANNSVSGIALQADGKILLGGAFTGVGPTTRNRIARLNADGTVDSVFNPDANNAVSNIALQSDGKILLGGAFTSVGGTPRNRIARLNADGSVDLAFNPDANNAVSCIALLADGKILLGGSFTSLGGTTRNRLARLDADGSVDPGFNPNVNSAVSSIALQADGRILLGGTFTSVDGTTHQRLARLNANGSVDAGFNPNANGADIKSFALQPDGKILIAGTFINVDGTTRNRIARLNADGTLDPDFNPNANNVVNSVALQADGKILIAGIFTSVGGMTRQRIARLNADGSVDAAFNPNVNSNVSGIAFQADGRILLGGDFTNIGGTTRNRLARLANDAAPASLGFTDSSHVQWLRGGTSPEAESVVFELSTNFGFTWTSLGVGTRIAGGWGLAGLALPATGLVRAQARIVAGTSESLMEAMTSTFTSPPIITAQPQSQTVLAGTNATLSIAAVSASPVTFQWRRNGTNLVGATTNRLTIPAVLAPEIGSYSVLASNVYGSVTSAAATLDAIPMLITSQPQSQTALAGMNLTLSVSVVSALPVSFQWLRNDQSLPGATAAQLSITNVQAADFGRYSVEVSNTYGSVASSIALLTALDAGFNPNANDAVNSIALQADGKILIGGAFTTVGVTTRSRIARINVDGSVDAGFNPIANNTISSLSVQPDGMILVGGTFTSIGGTNRNRIARLNADGTVDPDFNPSASNSVYSLALQVNGKILVGGSFTNLNGTTRNGIARLNSDGSVDAGFNPNAGNYVSSIALPADGKVLIGGVFTNLGGTTRNRMARLNADGSVDTGFNPDADSTVECFALQADGKILVGGAFTKIGGIPRNRIARLNSDGTVDAGFNPDANNSVYSLTLQADGKILVGGAFTGINSATRNRLARLNADGTVDANFNPNANDSIYSVALQADGMLLIGGSFTNVGGATRNRFARLSNDAALVSLAFSDASRVRWIRGGATPEAQSVIFELSTDAGATWNPLGPGTRISEGWELAGLTLPGAGLVRARARVVARGSDGLVETVTTSFASAPIITVQPQSQTVLAGTNATLRVVAASAVPATFQWLRNGTNIVGATADRLTIPAVLAPDTGLHSVLVRNAFGSVTSVVAVLDAIPMVITAQPQSQTVLAGSNVTLSVTATSALPLGFQWLKNGSNLPAATAAQLSITNVRGLDGGFFSAVVSNSYGSLTSSIAAVAVITAPLTNQQVVRRSNPQFSINVTSPVVLNYQWRSNGVLIAGATNRDYTISNVQTNQNADYSLVITQPEGAALTNSATLTVLPIIRRVPGWWPDQPLTVALDYSPSAGVVSHTFTEQIPTNSALGLIAVRTNNAGVNIGYAPGTNIFQLHPTNINFGGVFTNGLVKWGPFFDDQARVLTYTLMPSAGWTNIITLTGNLSEDSLAGGTVTIATPNDRSELLPLHPADHFAPANNYITFEELLNYTWSWQASLLWPVPPFSEPTGSYVNRAALIWRFGEYYVDKGGTAPGRWQSARPPTSVGLANLSDPTNVPIRKSAGSSATVANIPPTGNTTRTLSGSLIDPVAPFAVTLSLPAPTNANLMLIEEQLPPGWTAQAISDGGILDPYNAKVKWGPFFTIPPAGVTYQAVPTADARGAFTLSGRVGYSDGTIYAIGGTSRVTLGNGGPSITLQPQAQVATAGTSVQFSVGATGSGLSFQWSKDGVALNGATNLALPLLNVNRASSGTYQVVVTNSSGSATSTPAALRVLVAQQLRQFQWTANGSFQLLFNDPDGRVATDLTRFEVQAATNLLSANWLRFTNNLTLTNGMILFRDIAATNSSQRFYRVIEK